MTAFLITALIILAVWIAISIPVAIFVGKFIKYGDGR